MAQTWPCLKAVRARTDRPRRSIKPALERLALRYVERFATTRAKLSRYLTRQAAGAGVGRRARARPGGDRRTVRGAGLYRRPRVRGGEGRGDDAARAGRDPGARRVAAGRDRARTTRSWSSRRWTEDEGRRRARLRAAQADRAVWAGRSPTADARKTYCSDGPRRTFDSHWRRQSRCSARMRTWNRRLRLSVERLVMLGRWARG